MEELRAVKVTILVELESGGTRRQVYLNREKAFPLTIAMKAGWPKYEYGGVDIKLPFHPATDASTPSKLEASKETSS